MAKIFRFSGYFVDNDEYTYKKNDFEDALKHELEFNSHYFNFQQLRIEESEEFELDGEDKDNCDLALLERHFSKETETQFDRPIPKTGQKYRHFNKGKVVTVLALSRHTETKELLVVYKHEGLVWTRPLGMFMGEVDREKYPNATQKYRLELVEEYNADNVSKGDFANGYFTEINSWKSGSGIKYKIVYANDTKVKYLICIGDHEYGITPLYNADGSLQVYEEE